MHSEFRRPHHGMRGAADLCPDHVHNDDDGRLWGWERADGDIPKSGLTETSPKAGWRRHPQNQTQSKPNTTRLMNHKWCGGVEHFTRGHVMLQDVSPCDVFYITTPLPHLQTRPSWRYSRSLVYVLSCRDSLMD